jgi:hypothetical protein
LELYLHFPDALMGVDRDSFISRYVGGKWREFIVLSAAAGSRSIWNITTVRMLWMFYEKYKRLEKMYHYFIAHCWISQC